MSATSTIEKFVGSTAGEYALLGIVAIVAFVVVHSALKQDVKDAGAAIQHPFGQAFDDWFNNLLGGPTTSTPSASPGTPTTYPIDPNFGINSDSLKVWN